MTKYIDAKKLKDVLKAQIKEREEWLKDANKSDRQDQLWSDLNNEDRIILSLLNSLQQEQCIDTEKLKDVPKTQIEESGEWEDILEQTHNKGWL